MSFSIILTALIIYLAGTIILFTYFIYTKMKVPGNYSVGEIELETVSGIDYALFEDVRVRLEKEGFVKSGDYSSTNNKTKMYIRIFKNFNEGIRFQLAQAMTTKRSIAALSLKTDYEQGKSTATGTIMAPSGFKNAGVKVYKHIVNSPEEILELHRKHVKEDSKGRNITIDKLQLDDREYMRTENIELFETQKRYGIMKFIETEEHYRFTLYGSIQAAIKNLLYMWFKRPAVKRKRSRFGM